MDTRDRSEELLTEIRDLHRDSLALAKKQFAMAEKQFQRAEALHDRAEAMQDRGEGLMKAARKSLFIILPIILVLLVYLTWLIFR